jgi:hypothetical protein
MWHIHCRAKLIARLIRIRSAALQNSEAKDMTSCTELSLSLTAALHDGDLEQSQTEQPLVRRLFQDVLHLVQYLCTIVLILQGCSTAPHVLIIPSATETSQNIAYRTGDYEKTLGAITSVMITDLKLPAIQGSVTFYSSQASYEAGVMREAQEDLERLREQLGPRGDQLNAETVLLAAKRSAVNSVAQTMYKKVLVNEWRFSKTPRSEQLRILAHELTHLVQKEMVDGRLILLDQWLAEGFAEWVGYKVTDILAVEAIAKSRETALDLIATAKSYQTFPSLQQLVLNSDWITWSRTLGRPATYSQAFIAVDYLIEQKGLAVVIRYFGLFKKLNDHKRNFAAAFGEPISSFDDKFTRHLEALLMKRSQAQNLSDLRRTVLVRADRVIK